MILKGHYKRYLGVMALAVIATVIWSMTGCARIGPDPAYQGPRPLPVEMSHTFAYTRSVQVLSRVRVSQTPDWRLARVELAHPGPRPIVLDFYENRDHGTKSMILVLPILGGRNTQARHFARFFADRGYSSVVVHRPGSFRTWFDLSAIDQKTREMVVRVRMALDWTQTLPGHDARKTGILGISLGGIAAVITAAVEPRIRAGVIMLAGGDLPQILTCSKQRRVRNKRNRYMTQHGLSLNEFHNNMRQSISLDPIFLAPYIDARQILLVLAWMDQIVPYYNGRALARAMGGPETLVLFSGHYTSWIFRPHARQAAIDFFDARL